MANDCNGSLASFLNGRAPEVRTNVRWGTMPLLVQTYLTSSTPQLELVSSVRALVTHGKELLVLRDNCAQNHILPGGRSERWESPVETLRRELLEEIGMEICRPVLLGFLHFHHLEPGPEGYAYPYPDFLQLVYRVELDRHIPNARTVDAFVTSFEFELIDNIVASELPDYERPFLHKARGLL